MDASEQRSPATLNMVTVSWPRFTKLRMIPGPFEHVTQSDAPASGQQKPCAGHRGRPGLLPASRASCQGCKAFKHWWACRFSSSLAEQSELLARQAREFPATGRSSILAESPRLDGSGGCCSPASSVYPAATQLPSSRPILTSASVEKSPRQQMA